jgi:hypothetical protein
MLQMNGCMRFIVVVRSRLLKQTGFMEQIPSSEANRHSASINSPTFMKPENSLPCPQEPAQFRG